MIIVFGAKGQVGRALMQRLGGRAALGLGRAEIDLANSRQLIDILNEKAPSAVINAAAYTAVDTAESEPEAAHAANTEAPGAMARWCAAHQVPFVHYSTDYVFDGTGTRPWHEEAPPNPLSVYGKTKLMGEQAVAAAGGKYLIFRTSWVYDAFGRNFLNTMRRLDAEGKTLRVVADQIGAPTYAGHLAEATLRVLEKDFTPGIYHLCNRGQTSWHGFAEAILGHPVAAITTAEYPTPARRPLNSRLDCSKAARVLSITMPSWQEGLRACMEELHAR